MGRPWRVPGGLTRSHQGLYDIRLYLLEFSMPIKTRRSCPLPIRPMSEEGRSERVPNSGQNPMEESTGDGRPAEGNHGPTPPQGIEFKRAPMG